MERFNRGVIKTNASCIACNKCISQCPVFGANISVVQGDKKQIQVDSEKCIHCGKCITGCEHHAREFDDDCNALFDALSQGKKISLIVAPSFYILYPQKAGRILGYLKSLGVEKIYDAAFGAEICLWGHVAYLKEAKELPRDERAYISHTCPSIVNAIEKNYPSLLNRIIPVHSPMMCAAIYAKKYLNDANDIAFIGPCVAKRDEAMADGNNEFVQMSITFASLIHAMKDVKLESFEEVEADLKSLGLGDMIPMSGAFGEMISYFFPRDEHIATADNLNAEMMHHFEAAHWPGNDALQPLVVDTLSCKEGCQNGPGIDREVAQIDAANCQLSLIRKGLLKKVIEDVPYTQRWEELQERFKDLNREDFTRTFVNRFRQPHKVTKSAYNEIFHAMLKNTPEKQKINCGSCGYKSCLEMASAIALGYNQKENCIHYMNDMMQQTYMFNENTGLFTQPVFMKKAETLIANNRDKKYFVAYCNVNKLKMVNDIYGFEMGDVVLRTLAVQLLALAGEKGLVSYVGNGCYAMCIEYSDNSISRFMSLQPFDFSGLGIRHMITFHSGICVVEDRKEDIRTILNNANMAANASSSLIQNVYTYFSNDARERMLAEADLSGRMQRALEGKEYSIAFLPIFNANAKGAAGAEVICLWTDQDGVTHTPEYFMPLAEKTGIIKSLDREVWRMSFQIIRKWLDAGLKPLPLSLGISGVSLEADDTLEYISRLRDEYHVSNHYVRFIMRESAYSNANDEKIRRISYLKRLGYQIALENFGSGSASVNILKDMSVDILKIDMRRMKSEGSGNKGGTITTALCRMASDLELITEADGVETQSQADFLQSVGIRLMQGDLFSKPLLEHEFAEILKQDRAIEAIEKPSLFGKIDIGRFFDSSSYESIMFEAFSGPAALVEFDRGSGHISVVRCNSKGMQLLGCNGKDLTEVQALFAEFLKRDIGKKMAERLREIVISGAEGECIANLREQQKLNEIWVRAQMWEISRSNNRSMIYMLLEDITNERIVESTLTLSNQQIAYLTARDDVGTCLMHIRGSFTKERESLHIKVLRVNEAFSDISGYGGDEILGWTEREVLKLIHPQERTDLMRRLEEAVVDSELPSAEFVFKLQHKSGYYHRVRLIVTSTQTEDGSYMVVCNYIVDEKSNVK